jgi:hypothetical protein
VVVVKQGASLESLILVQDGLEVPLGVVVLSSCFHSEVPFRVGMVKPLGGEFDGFAISDLADDGVAGLASGPFGRVSHWGLLEEGLLLEEAKQAAVFGVHR